MRFLILSCGPPFSTEPTCVKFQTTLNVATFEFGIKSFASDLREKDDNRIIQVTQNLAGAGCRGKKKTFYCLRKQGKNRRDGPRFL